MDLYTFIRERSRYARQGIELIELSDDTATRMIQLTSYAAAIKTLIFLTKGQSLMFVCMDIDADLWLENLDLKRKNT